MIVVLYPWIPKYFIFSVTLDIAENDVLNHCHVICRNILHSAHSKMLSLRMVTLLLLLFSLGTISAKECFKPSSHACKYHCANPFVSGDKQAEGVCSKGPDWSKCVCNSGGNGRKHGAFHHYYYILLHQIIHTFFRFAQT